MDERTSGGMGSPGLSLGLTALAGAILAALVGGMVYCEIQRGQPFEFTTEDGLVEWGTVVSFGLCALVAGGAALAGRRILSRQRVLLTVFALGCLAAAGEEISWGRRYFEPTPTTAAAAASAPAPAPAPKAAKKDKAGHHDGTLHNKTFQWGPLKFSIGGFLFSLPLLLGTGFHGVLLPWALRAGKPWAARFVDRLGLFVPSIPLGMALFAGTLVFHFRHVWKYSQANECKEFWVPTVYVLILIEWLATRPPAAPPASVQ